MTKSEFLIKKYKENSEYTHGFVTDIETIDHTPDKTIPMNFLNSSHHFISKQNHQYPMDTTSDIESL